jgi:ABC-2 type transport system permease protein
MLNQILPIIKIDFLRLKKTPLVYFLSAGYVLVSGFFFFSLLKVFNPFQKMLSEDAKMNLNFNTGVIQPLFEAQSIILLFIIPFVTMRSLAEERQSGSLNLLLTTPIKSSALIIGKFFSTYLTVLISILIGLVFPFFIIVFGDPEIGPVLTGALGICLFSLTTVSLGILVSCLSPSQTVAGIFSLISGVVWLLIDLPFAGVAGSFIDFVKNLSLSLRLQGFFKGVISLSDLFFFLGFTYMLLMIATQVLSIMREE